MSDALTFSADDWATAQTVTVSGVAAGPVTISHTVSGGDYGGVVAPDVGVTVAVRAVTVEPMTLSVAVGGSNTYEVSLATQPTAERDRHGVVERDHHGDGERRVDVHDR